MGVVVSIMPATYNSQKIYWYLCLGWLTLGNFIETLPRWGFEHKTTGAANGQANHPAHSLLYNILTCLSEQVNVFLIGLV